MFRVVVACTVGTLIAMAASNQNVTKDREAAVAAVLDDWHKAAAAADEERYFNHFTKDAIMMGTDATEHWTRDEFRAWAKPHFAKGTGWSFKATKRHLNFSKDSSVAWFDELLDTAQLGVCRGSGVLVLDGDRWKIAQYNLSVPIPNEVFNEVKQVIGKAVKP
jgi:ketosteroid isomerase-like protein